MIGIYKITNKYNGKSYIGQSIHCGQRLDEHCKGKQLIDESIQIEGMENFTFELLKEVEKASLSYWEDYYIMKYDTMFPNGYNKRWNCNAEIRQKIEEQIKQDNEDGKILFRSDDHFLNTIKGKDLLYSYLLLNSNYSKQKQYHYILKEDVVSTELGKKFNKSRQTISKQLQELESNNFIKQEIVEGQKEYIIVPYQDSILIDNAALDKLMSVSIENSIEEVIRTYVWLIKQYSGGKKFFTYSELIKGAGHSTGNTIVYDRFRKIIQLLKEANIIALRDNLAGRDSKGRFNKTIQIYRVNNKVE